MKRRIIIVLFTIAFALILFGWYRDHVKLAKKITLLQNQQIRESQQNTNNKPTNPYANMALVVESIPAEKNTWGYKITANGRTIINQTNIPGFPGNLGFNLENNAVRAGEFVLSKIKKGQFPPTVTIDELNRLGVID